MAPTTLVGQVTTTSPYGRNPETQGMPARMAELRRHAGRSVLYRADLGARRSQHQQNEKSDQKGVPVSDGRKRLLDGRNPVYLPDKLGAFTGRGIEMA